MVGRTIGYYRILEKLGGGGMGVVYPPERVADPNRKRRFVQEASFGARLQAAGTGGL